MVQDLFINLAEPLLRCLCDYSKKDNRQNIRSLQLLTDEAGISMGPCRSRLGATQLSRLELSKRTQKTMVRRRVGQRIA